VHETTVRSRELGEALRKQLAAAGLQGTDAARLLGWSTSEVSRMLTGKRLIRETDVARLLGLCKTTKVVTDRLLKLCHETNRAGWYQQHGSRLPPQLRTYIDHEDKATAIHDFAGMLLPGALQTAEYTRAVLDKAPNVPATEVDERIQARMARRGIFGRRRAQFTYFVHESVLHVPIGGRPVMSEQLHELLRMSVRPYIDLRVVPNSLGAHAAMDGSFTLMQFAEIRPVVYLENATTTVFLEEPEETVAYQRIVSALAETALSREESKELISTLAIELYGGEDDLANEQLLR
jgi:transcriptional regulator with XRE-family HTH domain